ncbi:hypothetical protein KEM54_003329 [Ascosphaera aggregata]|nr:hypothetical protein KEM54_003329 [Ascosphaera aggregata]
MARGPKVPMHTPHFASEAASLRLPVLPSGAPDVVVEHTITVNDPRHIYAYQHLKRQREFYSLVQKLLLQGCGSPDCAIPTCFTFRKRVSKAPVRRYTELSARSIAHFLASEENAEDGLCPSGSTPTLNGEQHDSHNVIELTGLEAMRKLAISLYESRFFSHCETSTASRKTAQALPYQGNAEITPCTSLPAFQPPKRAPKKDPKSFTQNLFDTAAARVTEWMSLYNGKAKPREALPMLSHVNAGEANNLSCADLKAHDRVDPTSESTGSSRPSASSSSHSNTKDTQVTSAFSPGQDGSVAGSKRTTLDCTNRQSYLGADTSSVSPQSTARRQREPGKPRSNRKVSFNNFAAPTDDEPRLKQDTMNMAHGFSCQPQVEDQGKLCTPYSVRVESLSQLSLDIIRGLRTLLHHVIEDDIDEIEKSQKKEEIFSFVSQSVAYTLGNPQQLLQSFRFKSQTRAGVENAKQRRFSLDSDQLEEAFQILEEMCPWEMTLHCLWRCLDKLFHHPEDLPSQNGKEGSQRRTASTKGNGHTPSDRENYVNDVDAAFILFVALSALTNSITKTDAESWAFIRKIHSEGRVVPSHELKKWPKSRIRALVNVTDRLRNEHALRLGHRFTRAISARIAFYEIAKGRKSKRVGRSSINILNGLMEYFRRCTRAKPRSSNHEVPVPRQPTPAMAAVEFIRAIVFNEWDGSPEVLRSTSVGGAIQLLAAMYKNRSSIGLESEDFHTPFFAERLDPMEMPPEFLTNSENNRTIHLLRYSFLFPPKALVQYFRAMNYSIMSKYYEEALANERHLKNIAMSSTVDVYGDYPGLVRRMQTATLSFLLVVARRDRLVTDALDQLWRREKRELLRPLKVIMGMEEGEEGVDHGGVQQEFFRSVMAEILNPDYGMFTVDETTYSTWFQPGSLEPSYKFELLGLLLSLAVYNGLTLPVNFPLALYMKLLDYKVKSIDHIRVGWPELAKGFDDLLSWDDGDVGDVFMRTYEFSFEAFGSIVNVDMEKIGRNEAWGASERESLRKQRLDEAQHAFFSDGAESKFDSYGGKGSMLRDYSDKTSNLRRNHPVLGILKGSTVSSPPSPTTPRKMLFSSPSEKEEASLVTNENRSQFVKDYIFWLTDKSIRPQYDAFARGFYACLDRTALSIFTPDALKKVVEGSQYINCDELEKHARYNEGYHPSHPTIINFWNIVRQYTPAKVAALLEFVTASDRVPVNGITSIMFMIQRAGNSDERLPTSMTCFGRLLLPEYSSRAIMEEKLEKALQNTKGFGSP